MLTPAIWVFVIVYSQSYFYNSGPSGILYQLENLVGKFRPFCLYNRIFPFRLSLRIPFYRFHSIPTTFPTLFYHLILIKNNPESFFPSFYYTTQLKILREIKSSLYSFKRMTKFLIAAENVKYSFDLRYDEYSLYTEQEVLVKDRIWWFI